MTSRTNRPYSIADGMILIAAIAVGSLILRAYLPGFEATVQYSSMNGPAGELGWSFWWSWAVLPPTCMIVPLMAGLIAVALRGPRPRLRRLARRPGFVACVAAMASLVPGLAWAWALSGRPGFRHPDWFELTWNCAISWTAPTVLGAWLALGLGRRWRSEPHWIDRAGRVLGWYWVANACGIVLLNGAAELIIYLS